MNVELADEIERLLGHGFEVRFYPSPDGVPRNYAVELSRYVSRLDDTIYSRLIAPSSRHRAGWDRAVAFQLGEQERAINRAVRQAIEEVEADRFLP